MHCRLHLVYKERCNNIGNTPIIITSNQLHANVIPHHLIRVSAFCYHLLSCVIVSYIYETMLIRHSSDVVNMLCFCLVGHFIIIKLSIVLKSEFRVDFVSPIQPFSLNVLRLRIPIMPMLSKFNNDTICLYSYDTHYYDNDNKNHNINNENVSYSWIN